MYPYARVPKTIENLRKQQLNMLQYNPEPQPYGNQGSLLQIQDNQGVVGLSQGIARTIVIKPNANDLFPLESTTLYGAVQKALALNPTADNGVGIDVFPGTYEETQATVINQTLITINGHPQYYACRFVLVAPISGSWITVDIDVASIADVTFDGADLCDHVLEISNASNEFGIDCFRLEVMHGIISCIYVNGGTIYNVQGIVNPSTNSTYGVWARGGGGYNANIATVWCDTYWDSGDPTNYDQNTVIYHYIDGAVFQMFNDISYGGQCFLHLRNGSLAELYTGKLLGFKQCFTIENGANGGNTLLTKNITIEDPYVINNEYDDTNYWGGVGDRMPFVKIDFGTMNPVNTSLLSVDSNIDETTGIQVIGSMVVGSRQSQSMAFFGEGGADIHFMTVLRYNGTNYTNDTSLFYQSSAVTTALFRSTSSTNILYIGDSSRMATIEFAVNVVANPLTNMVVEYWNGAWAALNYMCNKAVVPYQTFANVLFSATGLLHLRIDITKMQSASNWTTTTVSGVLAYWIRIRLTGNFTTVPTVDYIKFYGSTTIIRGQGNVIHHGLARTEVNIPSDITNTVITGTGIIDADVWFSSTMRVGRINNSLNNNKTLTLCAFVPPDIDSGCPVYLRIACASAAATASQPVMNLSLRVCNVKLGDVMTIVAGAGTHVNEQVLTTTFTPNAGNGQILTFLTFTFYLPSLVTASSTGDITQMLVSAFSRTTDTNTNNFIILNMGFYYYSWRTTKIFVQ